MNLEDMMPLHDYAEMIGRNPVSVLQKIKRGNLPGAVKVGRIWLIPKDAEYKDERIKSGKYVDWRKEK